MVARKLRNIINVVELFARDVWSRAAEFVCVGRAASNDPAFRLLHKHLKG